MVIEVLLLAPSLAFLVIAVFAYSRYGVIGP
jgi:hypothetical protein